MKPEVDIYLDNLVAWQEELKLLRQLLNTCGLKEEFKWKHPCYTYNNKNIVLIHPFKNYCALLFFKGALLKDPKKILVQQTENTQSARQIRFTEIPTIKNLSATIKTYIYEAIEVEKANLEVVRKNTSDIEIPLELTLHFDKNPKVKEAFYRLTTGRQKGYLLHFLKPKQSKTKTARIIKCTSKIMEGYGLNDCTCGLTKRKPNCDGSHKQLSNK